MRIVEQGRPRLVMAGAQHDDDHGRPRCATRSVSSSFLKTKFKIQKVESCEFQKTILTTKQFSTQHIRANYHFVQTLEIKSSDKNS